MQQGFVSNVLFRSKFNSIVTAHCRIHHEIDVFSPPTGFIYRLPQFAFKTLIMLLQAENTLARIFKKESYIVWRKVSGQ